MLTTLTRWMMAIALLISGRAAFAQSDLGYDFTPGKKVLFEGDFARTQLGMFPRSLTLVEGNFDHFGKSLLFIGLVGRTPDLHLQGVDIVDDPALRQLAVNALASQPRNLRCRQTDRLTDGTPLYRCLITQLNAKPPLDAVPDSDRVDLALALVRNGVLLASCDAPRIYADAEDEARGRNAALWSRVKVLEYKKRCAR